VENTGADERIQRCWRACLLERLSADTQACLMRHEWCPHEHIRTHQRWR